MKDFPKKKKGAMKEHSNHRTPIFIYILIGPHCWAKFLILSIPYLFLITLFEKESIQESSAI